MIRFPTSCCESRFQFSNTVSPRARSALSMRTPLSCHFSASHNRHVCAWHSRIVHRPPVPKTYWQSTYFNQFGDQLRSVLSLVPFSGVDRQLASLTASALPRLHVAYAAVSPIGLSKLIYPGNLGVALCNGTQKLWSIPLIRSSSMAKDHPSNFPEYDQFFSLSHQYMEPLHYSKWSMKVAYALSP